MDVTAQLAGMVRPLADTQAPIAGWNWDVGEMASHLVTSGRVLADLASGASTFYAEGTKESLAAANASKLREFTEREGGRLADHMEEATRGFLASVAARSGEQISPTPMGDMDMATLTSYMLTHTIIHGYPLGQALGTPLALTAEYVELTLPFLLTAMRTVLDPERVTGLTATFLIHLRGGGPRLRVSFEDGALDVEALAPGAPSPRPVSCHISAEPVAFFLVAMGLKSQWVAIARGRMMAWGTRAWLAFSFNDYFTRP